MGVPRFTTPTITMTFDELGIDLTQMTDVYMTFEMDGISITKAGDDLTITPNSVSATLTQRDSGSLHVGLMEVQTNWKDGAGHRASSEINTVEITKQLLDRVI